MVEFQVKKGVYEHYSGKRYRVLFVGNHSETLEKVVIYQALYDDPTFGPNAVWARPYSMFIETVIIEGKKLSRFTLIAEEK